MPSSCGVSTPAAAPSPVVAPATSPSPSSWGASGRAAFALVANCDPYTYAGRLPLHVAPAARFELGLDLVAPTEVSPARLPVAAFSLLARPTHTRRPWVIHVHDADDLRVECDRPTPLQVDGEDLGDVTDAHFEAERDALDVLVPG
jgi:diacylglycerol kinase family enzyme